VLVKSSVSGTYVTCIIAQGADVIPHLMSLPIRLDTDFLEVGKLEVHQDGTRDVVIRKEFDNAGFHSGFLHPNRNLLCGP